MNDQLREFGWLILASVIILSIAIVMHGRYQPIGDSDSYGILDTLAGKMYDPFGKLITTK